MDYIWTKEEIKRFVDLEKMQNSFYMLPEDARSESILRKILYSEAVLLTVNKYVVVSSGDEIIGIYTFHEANRLESQNRKVDKLITYYPINFKSEIEFLSYCNTL